MSYQPNKLEGADRPRPGQTKRRDGILRHACGDCRRLKKRCSGDIPCSNCIKRGCEETCPEGVTRVGNEKRFTQAKLKAVRERNRHLATQINELRSVLSNHGDQPRPLQDKPSILKHPPGMENECNEQQPYRKESAEIDDTIDAFSSLSVSEKGRTVFFGPTANSWFLLQNEEGFHEDSEATHPRLPSIFTPWLNYAFSSKSDDMLLAIKDRLPSPSVARKLAGLYFSYASWMYSPVFEDEFHQIVFRRVYNPTSLPTHDYIESQNLAIVCLTLAIGTLLDTEKPPRSSEANYYYEMGWAALSMDSPLEQPSIPAIQALLLVCYYQLLAQIEGPRWVLAGLAVRLCLSIGLHRDSGRLKMSPEATKQRRALMWTVFTYDLRSSLHYGRPASLSPHYIDAKIAYGTTVNLDGELEMSYTAWQHRFSRQCHSVVNEYVLSGRKQNYKTILELDQKVRDFYVPPSLRLPGFDKTPALTNEEEPNYRLASERHDVFSSKLFTILYMHRGFFAKAMEECPDDPLASKYSPSVLAVYNAACTFVGLSESFHSRFPVLVDRMWFVFGHVFSCAVVLGSIACKRNMPLAPSAYASLETAYRLFEQLSGNPRSAKVLVVLLRLKNQAHSVLYPQSNVAETPAVNDETEHQSDVEHLTVPPLPPNINTPLYLPSGEGNSKDLESEHFSNYISTPDGFIWPSLLDVHYQGLEDVPSYPDPISIGTIEPTDASSAWQNFMEQFNHDQG